MVPYSIDQPLPAEFQGGPAQQGFWGLPRTDWLPDGRTMRLVQPYHYTCAARRVHSARANLITDGKTKAPRPFVGKARFAALIHDQICIDAEDVAMEAVTRQDWALMAEAHKMRDYGDRIFHEAAAFAGTHPVHAKGLYGLVRAGARWRFNRWGALMANATTPPIYREK